jgi:hypothetical protein
VRDQADRDVPGAPQRRARGRVREETPVRHPQAARHDRHDGVEDGQERCGQHDAATAARDEPFGVGPAGLTDAPAEPTAPQRPGQEPSDQKTAGPAGERADDDGQLHRDRRERTPRADRGQHGDVGRDQQPDHRDRVQDEDAAE